MVNVLIPIEDNYRLVITPRQLEFWMDFFHGWRPSEILTTLKFVLESCTFPPTAHDWAKLRPRSAAPDPATYLSTESPTATIERIADSATGYPKIVMEITRWGLKQRDADGHNRMPEAYDKLADAARRLGHHKDVERFAEAKRLTLSVRAATRATNRSERATKPVAGLLRQ